MCAKRESEHLTTRGSPSNMMLTALQTNPGSSSVFALHSSPAPSSAQQDQTNRTHLDDLAAQCGGMNKSPPSSSPSSSTTTINYQGLTPHLIPMATVPPPQVLIGSSAGGYTILPSITSLSGTDATFGNLASLHPIAAAGAGFTQASAAAPITAIQATYYPTGHHPSPPTPGTGGERRTSGGGGAEMYRSSSSPVAVQQLATSTATSSNSIPHHTECHSPHSHSRTGSGGHTQLLQNGNQTAATAPASRNPSDTKPIMNSLLLQQQQQQLLNQQQVASSSFRASRSASNGVLTSSSSDPSLHHSSGLSSSGDGNSSSERLGLDPAALSSSGSSGLRRASYNAIMHLGGGAPIEIKREPEDGGTTNVVQSCGGRRHSDSSSSKDAAAAAAAASVSVTAAASTSKSSPYPVSALVDVPVPMITPLNRSSRTSSLSSSLSSFRFGGSLSQLWASQISLSGKISNMKSTG